MIAVAARIPAWILAAPERVLINWALIVLGFQVLFFHQHGTAVGDWPNWLRVEWATGMIISGFASLFGFRNHHRAAERLGAGMAILCCLLFCIQIALDTHFSLRALPTLIIYLAIAAAKTVRLLRSIAVTSTLRNLNEVWVDEDYPGEQHGSG